MFLDGCQKLPTVYAFEFPDAYYPIHLRIVIKILQDPLLIIGRLDQPGDGARKMRFHILKKGRSGIHTLREDPCRSNRTSSNDHRSKRAYLSRSWSFFICCLLFRICMGHLRTRFAKPETQARKQTLALPNAQ